MVKHFDTPVDEDGDVAADKEDDPEQADFALVAPIVDEDLCELHGGESESMQREDQVLIRNLSHSKFKPLVSNSMNKIEINVATHLTSSKIAINTARDRVH